jgi:hypothetical protein
VTNKIQAHASNSKQQQLLYMHVVSNIMYICVICTRKKNCTHVYKPRCKSCNGNIDQVSRTGKNNDSLSNNIQQIFLSVSYLFVYSCSHFFMNTTAALVFANHMQRHAQILLNTTLIFFCSTQMEKGDSSRSKLFGKTRYYSISRH